MFTDWAEDVKANIDPELARIIDEETSDIPLKMTVEPKDKRGSEIDYTIIATSVQDRLS